MQLAVSMSLYVFSFLNVAAEQRLRGRVVGVEILDAVTFIRPQAVAELTHTPL
jgi:hypothetical protein